MSTYGDRGNILCLKRRLESRSIQVEIVPITQSTASPALRLCDIIVGGGAQDHAQELVIRDLHGKKDVLFSMFSSGIPGLFVCGSPQLLGEYYTTAEGKKLPGLGFFDFYTIHPGQEVARCIGNTVGEISKSFAIPGHVFRNTIVGFENHGGRTYLGKKAKAFAHVVCGYGNNGEDKTEGAIWNNVIACYYHGPLLAKNPHIADWLLYTALRQKYQKDVYFPPCDDQMEWSAHIEMLKKMHVAYE